MENVSPNHTIPYTEMELIVPYSKILIVDGEATIVTMGLPRHLN